MSLLSVRPRQRYSNLRAHERFALEVAVNMESDSNFWAGVTDNISEGGVFIATLDPPPIGAVIEISLSLPYREQPYWLKGEVRWHRPLSAAIDGAPAGIGVRFVEVPVETARAILRFVRERDTILFDQD